MTRLFAALRAYPTLVRIGFAEAVAYRAEMLIWMLTTTMPLVSLALWSAVAEGAPIGRFDQRALTTYFLATLVLRQLTGSWLVWQMNQELRSGALAQRLLRPIHPLLAYSAENLAAIPLRALISTPIAIVALVVTGSERLPTQPSLLVAFAASVLGAWLLNFFVMALLGALAFYTEQSTSVFEVWLVASMLLSGYLLPLELFPPAIRTATNALPFRYTLAFPVEIVTGLLDARQAYRELAIQWGFVLATGASALLAFRAGVRRFAAFGG